MNRNYCYLCKKPMRNSSSKHNFVINGIITLCWCHDHCKRDYEKQEEKK